MQRVSTNGFRLRPGQMIKVLYPRQYLYIWSAQSAHLLLVYDVIRRTLRVTWERSVIVTRSGRPDLIMPLSFWLYATMRLHISAADRGQH